MNAAEASKQQHHHANDKGKAQGTSAGNVFQEGPPGYGLAHRLRAAPSATGFRFGGGYRCIAETDMKHGDGLIDVLDLVLSRRLKHELGASLQQCHHGLGNSDASGRGQRL